MTTKAEHDNSVELSCTDNSEELSLLEQEVQDNWDAFLDMQSKYLELRGAIVRIDNILCAAGGCEPKLDDIGEVIEELQEPDGEDE